MNLFGHPIHLTVTVDGKQVPVPTGMYMERGKVIVSPRAVAHAIDDHHQTKHVKAKGEEVADMIRSWPEYREMKSSMRAETSE